MPAGDFGGGLICLSVCFDVTGDYGALICAVCCLPFGWFVSWYLVCFGLYVLLWLMLIVVLCFEVGGWWLTIDLRALRV